MRRVLQTGTGLPGNVTRACVAVVLLAGLVYLNALDNPFIYDDHRLLLEDPSLTDPTNLRSLLLRDATRPLVNISYAIDRTLWGPEPFGFHLTNVLLHIANVGLLFLLVWQMTGRRTTP